MGTTSSLQFLGLPYETLTFTKSAGVETNTITLNLTNKGGIIVIGTLTGGETIAITATNADGQSLGQIPVVSSAGAITAAATLAAGTYYLYLGHPVS